MHEPNVDDELVGRAFMLADGNDGVLVLWEFGDGGWRPGSEHEDNFRPAAEWMRENGFVQDPTLPQRGDFEQPANSTGDPILLELTEQGRRLVIDFKKPIK